MLQMFKRAKKYEKGVESSSASDSKAEESLLRQRMTQVSFCNVYATPWFTVANTLKSIAKVAAIEQSKPDSKPQGTLWERDEVVVKIVLETARLNVLLELLCDAYDNEDEYLNELTLNKFGKLHNKRPASLATEFTTYRNNLALLFKCCLDFIESVQVLDVPKIIGLMARNMDRLNNPECQMPADHKKAIFTFTVFYFYNIARRIGDIRGEKVIASIIEHDLLLKYLKQLAVQFPAMTAETSLTAVEALAAISDAEVFQDVLPSVFPLACCEQLVLLDAEYIQPLLQIGEENVRMSPIIDLLSHAYRTCEAAQG